MSVPAHAEPSAGRPPRCPSGLAASGLSSERSLTGKSHLLPPAAAHLGAVATGWRPQPARGAALGGHYPPLRSEVRCSLRCRGGRDAAPPLSCGRAERMQEDEGGSEGTESPGCLVLSGRREAAAAPGSRHLER